MGPSQKEIFMQREGDAYFKRNNINSDWDRLNDPVIAVFDKLELDPRYILEIGCGTCDRLADLSAGTARCYGIDPSGGAIKEAKKRFPILDLCVGTAEDLPFSNDQFDLVVFGFCLYLVDPSDYFSVLREADRVLRNKGIVIINDFSTPLPYSNDYAHEESIKSRKMDWSRMFTWNPAYSLIHRELTNPKGKKLDVVDERVTVDVLIKDVSSLFPSSQTQKAKERAPIRPPDD